MREKATEKATHMQAIALLRLVQRLLLFEVAESQDQQSLIEAAERVSDKLRIHLSRRIGKDGTRTLFARALTLTTAKFPPMSAASVAADGSLIGLRRTASTGLQEIQGNETQNAAVEGATAFLVHLLELLDTFIGADLTRRMLNALWPDLDLEDTMLEKNERT